MKTMYLTVVTAAWLATGCAQNSFTGGAGTNRSDVQPTTPKKAMPAPASPTPSNKGTENSVDTADAKKASGSTPGASTPKTPASPNAGAGTPGSTTDSAGQPGAGGDQSNPSTGSDQGSTLPNILGVLGGLLKQLKDVQVSQPSPNDVVFGGDKVFHIGDNNFDASTCKVALVAYPVVGTRYFFGFDVTQDGTQVDMSIDTICGVDYPDSNFTSLVDSTGTKSGEQGIPQGATSLSLGHQTLNKGTYQIVVESRSGSQENPTDHDDFIVGSVHIKGDKPINPGQVGADNNAP